MNKKIAKIIPLFVLSAGVLCSCHDVKEVKTLTPPDNVVDKYEKETRALANGIYDNTNLTSKEKNELCEKLETFAMQHYQTGIPLFDNSSIAKYSPRLKTPIDKEIVGLGYDVKHAKILPDGNMGNGQPASFASDKNYLHTAVSNDPGTFNGWISQGSDVSDRLTNTNGTYYEEKRTSDNKSWEWTEGLAKSKPIMLDKVESGERDENNHKKYVYKTAEVSEAEKDSRVSKHWRVKLKCEEAGDDIKYGVSENSKRYKKYGERKIKLQDYFTPYEMMLKHKLYRFSQLELEGLDDFANGVIDIDGVGVHLNEEEKALDFTLETPKNWKDAIYVLSSHLTSPIPHEFILDCGADDKHTTVEQKEKNGAETMFGKIGESTKATENVDNVISTGAYVVDSWEGKEIRFKKNKNYYDAKNIHIEGIVERVIERIETMYQEYKAGHLDISSIDPKLRKKEKNQKDTREVKGSTVFRLNLNTLDEKTWNEWFGVNGKYHNSKPGEKGFANDLDYYKEHLNPIVATPEFYKGVYFAINRKELADEFSKTPATTYFNEAYMYQGSKPFRETEEGQKLVNRIKELSGNEYGFSKQLSQQCFDNAIKRLINSNVKKYSNTTKKEIKLESWLFANAVENEGALLKKHIEDSFNNCEMSKKYNIKLTVENKTPGSAKWMDIYKRMETGRFAMALGGISGSTLDPIGIMRTLCTDPEMSWGFNSSWHEDTAKVFTKDKTKTLVWNDEVFAFDAMAKSYESPTVIVNGEAAELISNEKLSSKDENIVLSLDYEKFGFDKNPFQKWGYGSSALKVCEKHTVQVDDNDNPGKKKEVEKVTPFAGSKGLEVEVKSNEFGKLELVISKEKAEEFVKALAAERKAKCDADNKLTYKAPTHVEIAVELQYEYQHGKNAKVVKGSQIVRQEVKLSDLGIKL